MAAPMSNREFIFFYDQHLFTLWCHLSLLLKFTALHMETKYDRKWLVATYAPKELAWLIALREAVGTVRFDWTRRSWWGPCWCRSVWHGPVSRCPLCGESHPHCWTSATKSCSHCTNLKPSLPKMITFPFRILSQSEQVTFGLMCHGLFTLTVNRNVQCEQAIRVYSHLPLKLQFMSAALLIFLTLC